MGKRIFLFIGTNLAVMLTISVLVKALGLDRMALGNGIPLGQLAAISLIWGFAGAGISLLLSKFTAKMSMGVQVINAPRTEAERWLVETVERQARAAGIGMPEVGIFPSPAPNAFATGARRNHALVAVSSGLLETMQREEVEAVLGHEVAHVANGDMITMTLLQGVVNAFAIFLSKLAGFFLRNDRDSNHTLAFAVEMLLQIALTFLGSLIVAWFSRRREFRADTGGATLASRRAMINALARLGGSRPQALPGGLRTMGIQGVASLFSTHPPIAMRIAALEAQTDIH